MAYIPSAIRSVYTDGIILSVYINRIAIGIYRILKRSNDVMTWNFFRWFYQRNDREIQTRISVQWRGPFTVGITDREYRRHLFINDSIGKSQYIHTLPTLSFSISPSISTLPSQIATNHPSQLSPSSQHQHSSFLYFHTWSQHPFFDYFIMDFIIFFK
jgi:hypothetical protein